MRNDDGEDQRGVVVTGAFSGGYRGPAVGVTGGNGRVVFESGTVVGDSVTFRVINLTHPDYVYEPEDNRRGPTVTVEFD